MSGWFSSAALGRPGPSRVADTRLGTGAAVGRWRPTALTLTLPGAPSVRRGVNVTVTQPMATGFVTVYGAGGRQACGVAQAPDAPTSTSWPVDVANQVTVGAASKGRVCVKTTAAAHLIADASGWYASDGAALVAARPVRVLDTRLGAGGVHGPLAVNDVVAIRLADLPASATAAVLNLTAAEPAAAGFVKVWPADAGACSAANAPDVEPQRPAGTAQSGFAAVGGSRPYCASTTAPAPHRDVSVWFGNNPP